MSSQKRSGAKLHAYCVPNGRMWTSIKRGSSSWRTNVGRHVTNELVQRLSASSPASKPSHTCRRSPLCHRVADPWKEPGNMKVFEHRYTCVHCGANYCEYHPDECLYADDCPDCGEVHNEPQFI